MRSPNLLAFRVVCVRRSREIVQPCQKSFVRASVENVVVMYSYVGLSVFLCLCVCVSLCVLVRVCVCVRVLVASCARGVASCIAAPGQALRCIVRSGHRPSIALHRGFRPPAMQRCIVRFGLRPCIALQRAFWPPAMHFAIACVSATGQALRCIARCGRCTVRCGHCIVLCVYMFTCLHAWHFIPTACPSFLLSSLELPCCS